MQVGIDQLHGLGGSQQGRYRKNRQLVAQVLQLSDCWRTPATASAKALKMRSNWPGWRGWRQDATNHLTPIHPPPEAILSRLLDNMQGYDWPGKVRELENVCDRLAVFATRLTTIDTLDWQAWQHECPELRLNSHPATAGLSPSTPTLAQVASAPHTTTPRHQQRRDRALAALEEHGGHPGAAAMALGVSRSTLWRWSRLPIGPSGATEHAEPTRSSR